MLLVHLIFVRSGASEASGATITEIMAVPILLGFGQIYSVSDINHQRFSMMMHLSCAPYSRHPRVRNGGTGTQTPHYAQPDPNPWTCSDPKYFDFWSSRLVSRTDFVKWAFFWEFKISEIFGTKMAITRSFFDLLS